MSAPLGPQPIRGLAEERPEPRDFLFPAAGKHRDRTVLGAEAERASSRGSIGPRLLHERVAHELGVDPDLAEELGLEREDHRDAVDRGGKAPGPPRPPGPELGRDVVERTHSGFPGRLGEPDVEAGIVDGNHEIVAARAEVAGELAEQPQMRGDLAEDFEEADDGVALHRKPHGRTRGLECGSPECVDDRVGPAPSQGPHHGGGMRIPGGFAGRHEDSRGTACLHATGRTTGDAIAAVTRSASASAARPSAPLTTVSRSPRTA